MSDLRLAQVIGADAARLLDETRSALAALVDVAAAVDRGGTAAKNAKLVAEHVDEFFLLVVVGEVKSGKSSFINALLGERVQAEGPLPLTDRIWVLKHGQQPADRIRDEFVYEKEHPNEILRLFHIVDTPGTNSIVSRHQEITESFIPKADLTLFVTSIDRPFSESEHQFLNFVSDKWRKRVIFVLTKVDTREPEEVAPVIEYVKENCRKFYGFEPRVFPISAKRAEKARLAGDAAGLAASGLQALLDFLSSSLAEQERVQLKLTSPLEAGLALLDEIRTTTEARRSLLERDFASLTALDSQVKQAATELRERANVYIVTLYDLLREFERRGKNFFEATIRVANFGLLRNATELQRRFEKEAVGELRDKIHDTMHAATDWLMKEQIGLFERSLRFLSEHLVVDKYRDRVAAQSPQDHAFEYHRGQLVEAMKTAFKREIERFDPEGEVHRIMETAYRGILQQLGLQAGAVGLGALLVSILTGVALDISGILAAGALFATGFVILPRKKRKAIQEFSLKVDALVREFKGAILGELDREIGATTERLKRAYEPYLTFYRAESAALGDSEDKQKSIRLNLMQLLESVKALKPAAGGDDKRSTGEAEAARP